MTPVVGKLKNWTVVKANNNLYLKGYVYGHINPEYASDGDQILTSHIITSGNGLAFCVDGLYELGE